MAFDEEIPYRSAAYAQVLPERTSSVDERNFDTLRVVRGMLADGISELDKWHAFDLKETDGLTMKQQIKAHKLAHELLSPLLEAVDNALQRVNGES